MIQPPFSAPASASIVRPFVVENLEEAMIQPGMSRAGLALMGPLEGKYYQANYR
jgi:hypothetical protein